MHATASGCCPQTSNTTLLKSYYMQAYSTVRKYSNCFVALCPPESQNDGSAFQSFMAAAPYTKVIQDVHRCGCADTRVLRAAVREQQHVTQIAGLMLAVFVDFAPSQAKCSAKLHFPESTKTGIHASREASPGWWPQVLQHRWQRAVQDVVAERVRQRHGGDQGVHQERRPAAGHRRVDPGRCAACAQCILYTP